MFIHVVDGEKDTSWILVCTGMVASNAGAKRSSSLISDDVSCLPQVLATTSAGYNSLCFNVLSKLNTNASNRNRRSCDKLDMCL